MDGNNCRGVIGRVKYDFCLGVTPLAAYLAARPAIFGVLDAEADRQCRKEMSRRDQPFKVQPQLLQWWEPDLEWQYVGTAVWYK